MTRPLRPIPPPDMDPSLTTYIPCDECETTGQNCPRHRTEAAAARRAERQQTDAERIAEIRKLVEAATPGPWTAGGDCIHPWEVVISGDQPFVELPDDQVADAEFIARSRTNVPFLLDKLEQARTALAYERHARHEREQQLRELVAERDRARATAVALEQDAAAAEEARQVWAKAADERLVEVKAERDRLAELVQRVCDLPLLNFSPINDPRVAHVARAWSEAVADSVALLDEMDGEVPDA